MEKANVLYNIVEVEEVTNVSKVNERLRNGWILLEMYTTTYDPHLFYKHQSVTYVLGRPGEPRMK